MMTPSSKAAEDAKKKAKEVPKALPLARKPGGYEKP